MKKFYILLTLATFLTTMSCKPTLYMGNYGEVNQTQVVLSNGNFNVLGSFTGAAIAKKSTATIKNKSGLIALAKEDMLLNAKNAGIALKGSRALINISTDITDHSQNLCVIWVLILIFV